MINNEIIINKQTRAIINKELLRLGTDGENLQENIIFKFEDEFVNGTARVEITTQDDVTSYVLATKQNETYTLPIRSIITKKGLNKMQLVITQGTNDEEIPIFKSETFLFMIDESINAQSEAPEEYPQWIDEANTKLNELDNIDIDVEKVETTATITITKKDGTEESVNIYDGTNGTNGQDGVSPTITTSKSGKITTIEITDKNGTHTATINDGEDGTNGVDGKDAKINNVNTLTLEAGSNITLNQSGSTLTISSTASGGTSNYSDLSNKPKINNVELNGNKTSSNLGLQSEITNNNKLSSSLVSGLSSVATSGSYNDLSNKPTIPTNSDFTLNGLSEKSYNNLTDKPTNVSTFTNDAGYLTQHQDISGKLDTSKVKSAYSTTSGDVYDVSYINSTIGDIETLLSNI